MNNILILYRNQFTFIVDKAEQAKSYIVDPYLSEFTPKSQFNLALTLDETNILKT